MGFTRVTLKAPKINPVGIRPVVLKGAEGTDAAFFNAADLLMPSLVSVVSRTRCALECSN